DNPTHIVMPATAGIHCKKTHHKNTLLSTMDPDLRRGDDKAHTHRHTGDGRYPLQKNTQQEKHS
ncbi:MAG: hypothetical protein J6K82_01015, partial [Alphaproteobacteria bacterium]|nr:hypothetical protein [Alphaproteobacteria bacterium]